MVDDFRLNSSRLVSLWAPWRKEAEKQHAMHAWPEDGCPREKTCLILAWSIYRITTFKLRKHTRCWEYKYGRDTRGLEMLEASLLWNCGNKKRSFLLMCMLFTEPWRGPLFSIFIIVCRNDLTALNEKEQSPSTRPIPRLTQGWGARALVLQGLMQWLARGWLGSKSVSMKMDLKLKLNSAGLENLIT